MLAPGSTVLVLTKPPGQIRDGAGSWGGHRAGSCLRPRPPPWPGPRVEAHPAGSPNELRPEGLVIVSGTSRLLARQSCANAVSAVAFLGRTGKTPAREKREKRDVMEEASVIETNENIFALEVQVITDVVPGAAAAACTSDDGCGSTCASACASTY
jgi:FxLD family lantipeptide